MRYEVQLSRVFRKYRVLEVEADSPQEAEQKALKESRKDDEEGTHHWLDELPGRRRVEYVSEKD